MLASPHTRARTSPHAAYLPISRSLMSCARACNSAQELRCVAFDFVIRNLGHFFHDVGARQQAAAFFASKKHRSLC